MIKKIIKIKEAIDNNKVFKLIQSRLRFEIPYHPRIMMPQFRRKFEDLW